MTQELKVLIGIGIATLALLAGAVWALSRSAPASQVDINLLTQNAIHKIGKLDSKVVVTEFADYQCPACAIYNPLIKQLVQDYKDRVLFTYRHFPLPQHIQAIPAINAAEAAGEQGKFWEMSAILYDKQLEWSEKPDPKDIFLQFAQELKLDVDAFTKAYSANKYQDIIQKDLQDAKSAGVSSTPTIFINNSKFTKPLSYQSFKEELDRLLSQ